jgi:hypothetical protein
VTGRKPVRQVQDHPGKKPASAAGTQQHAQYIELRGRLGKGRRHGHQPPQDHDAGHGLFGADLFQQQITGDFEQQIADGEHPDNDAEGGITDVQVGFEAQVGKANIDPVQPIEHKTQKQKGHDPPGKLAVQA